MADQSRKVVISTPSQWKAVLSIVRLEMVEILRRHGRCSLAQIAMLLDRPADGLYHHIRKLGAAGIVRAVGTRKAARSSESLFALCGEDLHFPFNPADASHARNFVRLVELFQRMGAQAFAGAVRARRVRADASVNWTARAELAWLDEADYAAVKQGLVKLISRLDECRDRRDPKRQLYCITFLACPVVRKRGAKRPAGGGKRRPTPEE